MAPPIIIGGTYIATYQGTQWPVVIVDDRKAPRLFQQSRRQSSDLAAILLGRYKYIWVSSEGLAKFRPNRDYLNTEIPSSEPSTQRTSIPRDVMEKQRHIAFYRDAPELRDDRFWQRFIAGRAEAREITKEQRRNDQGQQNDEGIATPIAVLLEQIKTVYPLPAAALISLVENLYSVSSFKTSALACTLETWIVENIVERWVELKTAHRNDLNRILASHKDLQEAVGEKLIALPASRKRGFIAA